MSKPVNPKDPKRGKNNWDTGRKVSDASKPKKPAGGKKRK